MLKKSLVSIQVEDKAVERALKRIETSLNEVTDIEIIDGVRLTSVQLSTGSATALAHKLGRAPLGWIVTRIRGNANVWDTQDTNKSPDKSLILNSSADVIVDLWIF